MIMKNDASVGNLFRKYADSMSEHNILYQYSHKSYLIMPFFQVRGINSLYDSLVHPYMVCP